MSLFSGEDKEIQKVASCMRMSAVNEQQIRPVDGFTVNLFAHPPANKTEYATAQVDTRAMPKLRSADEPIHPRPEGTLWVKLKLPALWYVQKQIPVPAHLWQEQAEHLAKYRQNPPNLVTLPGKAQDNPVDSPQAQGESTSTPHEQNATPCDADGGDTQGIHLHASASEKPPSFPITSILSAPKEDATTTAGAPSQESPPQHYFTSGENSRNHHTDEPDSECIRVAMRRSVGESGPCSQPGKDPERTQRKRVSISISELLRPVSEEPVEQEIRSQKIVADEDTISAAEAAHVTPAAHIFANELGSSDVSTTLAAETATPRFDHDMQEPDPTAARAAAATATRNANVTIRLSPAGMAKLAALPKPSRPGSVPRQDRTPKRSGTRAFSAANGPLYTATTEKTPAPLTNSTETAAGAKSKKRSAQSNGEPATVKRHKTSNRSPITRSSPSPSAAPALLSNSPATPTAPTFELDASTGEPRPIRDVEGDQIYAQRMLSVLEVLSGNDAKNDVAKKQSRRIKQLLQSATVAQEDEALFLTAAEAEEQCAPGKFWNNIIITAEQQTLPLQTIDGFLGEFYEDNTPVSIQDCSAKSSSVHAYVRSVKIKQIKERFAPGIPLHPKPWNLLELATHHDDGLRPAFLNGEDCRLLTKLKIPTAADHSRRRTYPEGYKEVEKWALLAQAGALTEPHQDSHGYSTYITVNVGLVGFGWLSSPTAAQRNAWSKNTHGFIDGSWRYVIVKPGQTVYFPAGTVHFVFRLPEAGNTLAFGGHVLRCSNIVHWVKCLLEERASEYVSNEDISESAIGYLDRVEKFVKQARKTKDLERWGGAESVTEFLRLKAEFLSTKQKSPKKGSTAIKKGGSGVKDDGNED